VEGQEQSLIFSQNFQSQVWNAEFRAGQVTKKITCLIRRCGPVISVPD